MNDQNIAQVIKRIRAVVYHVGTFESSYPRILKNAPIYTRSHLIVLYEILPYLKHLLKFSSETIPVVTKILGIATEGKSDLEQASAHLHTINKSSESAVTEIFAALDQVSSSLRKAQKAEEAGEDLKQTLKEANAQLMGIMNALQFQDITSQKIEATNALLARLGDGLIELVGDLGVNIEQHSIKVREGTYDADAAFDRDRADSSQHEIDDIIGGTTSESNAKPAPKPEAKPAEKAPKNATKKPLNGVKKDPPKPISQNGKEHKVEETVVADDIDSLIASAKDDTKDDTPVDIDDIDSLIASTKDDTTAEEPADDIDDIIASAQEEESAEPANFNQDDIDALLGGNKN